MFGFSWPDSSSRSDQTWLPTPPELDRMQCIDLIFVIFNLFACLASGFHCQDHFQVSAVENVRTVYASADQSAMQVTLPIPRTLNGAMPRLVLVSALIVSLVEARCL